MRRSNIRILLAAPVLAALSACGDTPPDPRGIDRDETLLSVSATGEAQSVPDLAHIEIGIEGFAANAKAAGQANAEKAKEITAALAKFGIEEKDLRTRNLSVGRVSYGPRRGQYQASNILSVTLRDAKKAGEVVAAVTDAGANVVSGPSFEVSDPEKANRGAYIAAYKAARTRAEAYAEAAEMEIARVLVIRDGGAGGPEVPYYDYGYARAEMAVEEAAADAAPPIHAGTTRVSVSVQVDFVLEPK